MALFIFFLLAATAVQVAGLEEGFLSIDCGLDAAFSGLRDAFTNISYVSDGTYVDGGENHKIAADLEGNYVTSLLTLRSFPNGTRNCYTLPTQSGGKYLVRMMFLYANYDGQNRSSIRFDLYLGTNYWDTYQKFQDGYWISEAIFLAWANWVPVCLVNKGRGTPFVSTLELRPLGPSLYTDATTVQSLSMYDRKNMGASRFTRFPADPYDRFWYWTNSSTWESLYTNASIEPEHSRFAVPNRVLQTAAVARNNGTVLQVGTLELSVEIIVVLHFTDFQNTQLRQFDIHINDQPVKQYIPNYLNPSFVEYPAGLSKAIDGRYNISLTATNISALPPMINAYEVYTLIRHDNPTTFSRDCVTNLPSLAERSLTLAAATRSPAGHEGTICAPQTFSICCNSEKNKLVHQLINRVGWAAIVNPAAVNAMMAIKLEYGVKKNWMGDPCFPATNVWSGVKCRNTSDITMRIISLDLSNSNLTGVISDNFTLLTELQFLDLSGNSLNGPIPYTICKESAGPLVFRYESGQHMCSQTTNMPPSKNKSKIAIISISVVIPMVVVVGLVLSYLIWRRKRKPKISTRHTLRESELQSTIGSTKRHGEHLQTTENRRFTYKELEKFTNKFELLIGQGGFGLVYYGRLEDDSEIAVKMRSESSTHGLDEFLAEVHSLTKVHHRNLVSLVGYCLEKDHLALVYEYMSRGNLCDHLRGKNGEETLDWAIRVRVVLEAAQGLDYLHKGCSLPIIHRDVKTSNILLGQNLRAKLADFGLSKTYLSETQTHISTNAAGSAGYFDPEYYHTGRLTESSDVYSFGVVLLEIVTGEPPILSGRGHIVQRVKQKMASGNISSVADMRLGGAYEVTSMWKVVDIAMSCTSDTSIQRPSMASVVVQLKESLALEESREDSGVRVSPSAALVSTFGPSAR